jgi:molybdopterin-guanine dinucleotide biosynthesis protein MobB
MSIPVITVIGKSGSGKTTLLEKLITELTQRGYRVATVKHHSHSDFEIDYPGKDSWRHARAGSLQVYIVAPNKIAFYRDLDHPVSLDNVTNDIRDVDIILCEGYKHANKPTLVVVRAANKLELVGNPQTWFAVAADTPLDVHVPQYNLNDYLGIADLIEERFLNRSNSLGD